MKHRRNPSCRCYLLVFIIVVSAEHSVYPTMIDHTNYFKTICRAVINWDNWIEMNQIQMSNINWFIVVCFVIAYDHFTRVISLLCWEWRRLYQLKNKKKTSNFTKRKLSFTFTVIINSNQSNCWQSSVFIGNFICKCLKEKPFVLNIEWHL